MAVKCELCGLRYRGVVTGAKPSPEKVERHNAAYSHQTRVTTLSKQK